MNTDREAQDVLYDALVHLARMKSTLIDRLLLPANVPAHVYEPVFLYLPPGALDYTSRQQAAAHILSTILAMPARGYLLRALVSVVAGWTDFKHAEDPSAAQAVVRRAWRLTEHWQISDSLIGLRAELGQSTQLSAQPTASALQSISPEAALLLRMWQDVPLQHDPNRQAWLMQDLLNRLFLLHEISLSRRFSAGSAAGSVAGVCQLNGQNYPIECHWQSSCDQPAQPILQLTPNDLSAILSGSEDLRAVLQMKVMALS